LAGRGTEGDAPGRRPRRARRGGPASGAPPTYRRLGLGRIADAHPRCGGQACRGRQGGGLHDPQSGTDEQGERDVITQPHHVPERLALLSGSAADAFLTEGLLRGEEVHSGIDLTKVVEPLPEDDARWSVEPIRSLVDDAMFAFDKERTRADAWLAPRLHATLRLTRQEAADKRLWNHLALAVAPDYVVWRHLTEPSRRVAAERFQGPADRQCFSRLWWAAELFRNGPDYRPVEVACGNQDLIHTVLRRDLIDHRPTAQALVRLLQDGKVTT